MVGGECSLWRASMENTRERLGIQKGVILPPKFTDEHWRRLLEHDARINAEKLAKEAARKRDARKMKAATEGRAFRSRTFLGGMSADALRARKAQQNKQHQTAHRQRQRVNAQRSNEAEQMAGRADFGRF